MIGNHISFKNIDEYYKTHTINTPIQVFTGSPRSYARKELVLLRKIPLFVHSSYIINIGKDDHKGLSYLEKDLFISNEIGALGLVVHVGKYLKGDPDTAILTMYKNIMNIIEYISVNKISTKFLLETPAGQGTELLTDIDDFITFCKKFKKHFGIVVDTCHVFASGYNPAEYVKKVLKSGLTIDLVHLNDSKGSKGSRVDRHEYVFKGLIPKEELTEVIDICTKHKIPMVYELE